MSIGQFSAFYKLVCGLHLTADANDFSGHGYNGTPSNMTYVGDAGIIGGAGAQFNGSNSKIYMNNAVSTTYITRNSYSMAALVKLPSSAPSTQPIFARGIVLVDGYYYGTGLILYSNQAQFVRNIGASTNYAVSAPYTFESSKKYLIGLTVNKTSTVASIYIYPLESKGRAIGSGMTPNAIVMYSSPYDQGMNIGANLRNTSNKYSSISMNEFLIVDAILPESWFSNYAALLRGFR